MGKGVVVSDHLKGIGPSHAPVPPTLVSEVHSNAKATPKNQKAIIKVLTAGHFTPGPFCPDLRTSSG